jgi:hypothetical protein
LYDITGFWWALIISIYQSSVIFGLLSIYLHAKHIFPT